MIANPFVYTGINALLSLLPPQTIKGFIDKGLAGLTKHIKKTKTQIDDKFFLPSINLLRAAIEVPDETGKVNVDGELKKLFGSLGGSVYYFADAGLDYVENAVIKSKNPVDDTIVLPLCTLIRKALNIPDND